MPAGQQATAEGHGQEPGGHQQRLLQQGWRDLRLRPQLRLGSGILCVQPPDRQEHHHAALAHGDRGQQAAGRQQVQQEIAVLQAFCA